MKIIAHRGNLDNSNPLRENSPEYIDQAIESGFDVEIDLRCENNYFYLGHDKSQYQVSMLWLYQRKDKLWIHCKDVKSMEVLSNSPVDFHYFWHESDRYTITSKGFGLVLVGQFPFKNSVIVMPEKIDLYSPPYGDEYIKNSYAIITDKPILYKNKFGVKDEVAK